MWSIGLGSYSWVGVHIHIYEVDSVNPTAAILDR